MGGRSLRASPLCNTDVGAPASYVVQESDVGSVINNNAVVTVETLEDPPREFQQTAQTEVLVPVLRGLLVQFCHAEGNGSYQWHANSKQGLLQGHLGHANDIVPPLPPELPNGYNWWGGSSEDFVENQRCEGTSPEPPNASANANANCDGLTVDATGYPAGSRVEVVIDGSTTLDPVDAQGNLHKTYTWTQTVNHTWSVTVLNPNGDRWAVNNGTWNACQPPATSTLPPTPVSPAPGSAVVVTQSVCSGGVASPATVVVPSNTSAIAYSRSPNGSPAGSYAAATLPQTVTVRATLASGYQWTLPLQTPWVAGSPAATAPATYQVTLNAAPTCTVSPAPGSAVVVTQSVCSGGVASPATVVVPSNTSAIAYSRSPNGSPAGSYAAATLPQTVTVRATLTSGYQWTLPLQTPWVAGSPAATAPATYQVTLNAAPTCTVSPAPGSAVVVTQSVCSGGVASPATVVVPSNTSAIAYSRSPNGSPAGSYAAATLPQTVTVSATLTSGYQWTLPLQTPWVAGSPAATAPATYQVTLNAAPTCTVSPAPGSAVVVTQSVCSGGVASPATVVVPSNTSAIAYSRSPNGSPAGSYAAATLPQTVTVSATLTSGYQWTLPLQTPWVAGSPAATAPATYQVTLNAAPTCTVSPAPGSAVVVTQSVCSGGVASPATVVVPSNTSAIAYSRSPNGSPAVRCGGDVADGDGECDVDVWVSVDAAVGGAVGCR